MKKITVFTPTFNRAYCLHQLYDSLCKQSSQDFKWLIIDDGSTDDTKELVDTWVLDGAIEIQYHFKKNGGMHTGHNTAYELIETELNVCIDSDDFMSDNAVEVILNFWKLNNDTTIAGIVGLDSDKNGKTIGTRFPLELKESTLYDIYYKWGVKGDKKLVLRTDVVKKYPKYPLFKDERFVPLGILYLMIDQDYKLKCLNPSLCIVEYLEDGSSLNIFNQYKKHPKGFRYSRIIELKYIKEIKLRILKVLHFISSTLFIGDFNFFRNNPAKMLTFFCLPFGFLFHIYVLSKIDK